METQEGLNIVLEDPGWIYQLIPGHRSYISQFFGDFLGSKSGLIKGAVVVAVCSALLLAFRRCYKQYQLHHHQYHLNHRHLPAPPPTAIPSSAAVNGYKAKRSHRMIMIPRPIPEASKLSSSPVTDITRRSSSRSSRMAILKFTDTDSEDEQSCDHVPQKIEYTPVVDEVEAEADDESSEVGEQEDDELSTGNLVKDLELAFRELALLKKGLDDQICTQDESPNDNSVEGFQESVGMSEFNLSFETNSDSSHIELDSDLSLNETVSESVNGHGITITLNNSTTLFPGCEDGERFEGTGGTDVMSQQNRDTVHHRNSTLDQLNSSSVESGVVVTKAIVTIG